MNLMPELSTLLRRALLGLVIGLPLLVVIYAIVMGGAALLDTLGDANGALGLRWAGTVLAMLFVAGSVVLLLILGWKQITSNEFGPSDEIE